MGLSNPGDLVHRGRNHVSGPATLKADAGALLGHRRVLLLGEQVQAREERRGAAGAVEQSSREPEGRTANCQWESKQTKGAECLEELAFWP